MEVKIIRWDGSNFSKEEDRIIVCGQYESIRECLEKNRNKTFYRADLQRADLKGADLQRAYLQGAYLQGAYLQRADLQGAYLQGADLQRADLQGAYLQGAYLQGADLQGADLKGAYLQGADLQRAYLQGADLKGADLQGADLQGAYLQGADLKGADLQGADLKGAYLQGADLQGAKYKEPLFLPDLYSLKLQPKRNKLRFWKYLQNGKSPYQYSKYEVGKTYTCKDYLKDEQISCGKGLSVATLIWCLLDNSKTDEFIEVEFIANDIIAVPFGTDGKFRVKKFKVIKKYTRKQVVMILNKAMRR